MKLSEFNTNEAADVLCEITPLLDNICTDEALVEKIGKAIDQTGMSKYGLYMETLHRLSNATPVLLRTHRLDVFGILGLLNKKTIDEIGAQPLMETLNQIKEMLQDEELVAFFGSSLPLGQNA